MESSNSVYKKPRIGSKLLLIVIVVVVLIGTGVVAFFLKENGNDNSATPNTGTGQTFISNRLGLKFTYAGRDLNQNIKVKEMGNTVYVYYEGTDPSNGQYVRAFNKDAKQSLQQAVEDQLLKGYNSADCFVQSGTDLRDTQPSLGVAAVIAFPVLSDTNSVGLENRTKCPQDYSLFNGISYFWTDREDSTKFVFFSIGQYYIPVTTTGTSWHDTLEFVR